MDYIELPEAKAQWEGIISIYSALDPSKDAVSRLEKLKRACLEALPCSTDPLVERRRIDLDSGEAINDDEPENVVRINMFLGTVEITYVVVLTNDEQAIYVINYRIVLRS